MPTSDEMPGAVPSPSPAVSTLGAGAGDLPRLSLAWRCSRCGRYHLQETLVARPPACISCGSDDLTDAGPLVEHADDGSEP